MLLCVHLIKYQSFWASPSAVKACTGRMIYFYQVFPLLRKCSADATALHFTVAVFCTYTAPIPCSLAGSILRQFCLRPGLLVLDPFAHQLGAAPLHVHPSEVDKNITELPLEMQIRTLTKKVTAILSVTPEVWGHTSALQLRAPQIESPSPRSLIRLSWSGDGRRVGDACETSHGLFSWVWCCA